MKKIKYIPALIAALVLTSCFDMDKAPYDSVAQGNFWQTEQDARRAIMGVYSQLKEQGAFGYMPLMDTYSDIAHGPGSALEIGSYTATEDFLVSNWQDTWDGVHRANTVLANVPGMKIDDDVKTRVLGEAYFLRALYYFHLVDLFGSVPLYDESWDISVKFMDMTLPRNTADQCWTFIKEDLGRAIELLPVEWEATEYGRATKGSAFALRGKAHLYTKDYGAAVADFEEIVYDPTYRFGYELYPDYNALFQSAGAIPGNREEVFTIQNKGTVGALSGMEFPMIYGTRGTYGSGRQTCMPSVDMADMYEMRDGRPFDWDDFIPGYNADDNIKTAAFRSTLNAELTEFTSVPDTALLGSIYRGRDPRLMQSIIVPYSWYTGYVGDEPLDQIYAIAAGATAANGFIQGRGWNTYLYRKFVPEGDMNGQLTDRRHLPVNFSIIRYADVLLMLAEAYNETGQLDKAVVEVNKVRARQSTGMPGLNSGPAWLQVNTKEQMFERIRHERAVELLGEGHRFSDLRRWGVAEQILNGRREREITGATLMTRASTPGTTSGRSPRRKPPTIRPCCPTTRAGNYLKFRLPNMKNQFFVIIPALLLGACAGETPSGYSPELTVEAVTRVVNDAVGWQLDNMPTAGRETYNPRYTGWADGVFLGAVAEWTLTDDSRGYRERLRDIADRADYLPAPRTLNPANDVAVSMLYANLYLEDPKPQYLIETITDFQKQLDQLRGGWKLITPTIERLDYQMKYYPELETLDFYQAPNQERWCWCDALYMAGPTYAVIANITGRDEYRDFMNREFWRTTDELYDPDERLFYRDTRYFDMHEPNGSKVFWGRGNGWVVGAIARIVELLPAGYPDRGKYLSLFSEIMSRIISLQDDDGYWHTSLLDTETYSSPETSATGFYTYALWWGINNGVIDSETYLPAAVKAWTAMVGAVHPDGMLGWVQPIGDAPENIAADKNEVYGTAALALAGTQVIRYIQNRK